MGELLLLAAGVFFGIMFGVFIISGAFEAAGVWGLIDYTPRTLDELIKGVGWNV